jgi:Ca-activated chloride channel family protein
LWRVLALTGWLSSAAAGQQGPSTYVETRFVEVNASVFDSRGRPIPGLSADQFVVREDGVEQKVTTFWRVSEALCCLVLMDTTGSLSQTLPLLKAATIDFIDQLRSEDPVGVFEFTTSFRVLEDFTTDRKKTKQAVLRARAGGATALFDALPHALAAFPGPCHKRAIVLLTDGADNSSTLNAGNAVARIRKAGVPLFTIAQGDALKSKPLISLLRSLADETGGLAFEARQDKQLAEAFRQIQRNLSHLYVLGYVPPPFQGSGWRSIRVEVPGLKEARIRAKQGYLP